MPNENNNMTNTIKYSIWDTRTNENQPFTKKKFVGSMDRNNLKSKTTNNQE